MMEATPLVIFLSLTILGISAQDDCPASSTSLTCERSCAETRTCRKAGKACECDGDCGWSCLPKGCEVIDLPENGNVAIDPVDRAIGSIATFTCSAGYTLRGSQSLECLNNKTWSSSTETACECLRNEAEVRNQPGRCLKICASDDDCDTTRGRTCVCDGICGLSCIRAEDENYCDTAQLESANAATVIDPPSAVFRTIARQTCLADYISGDDSSSSTERQCLGNRAWSNENLLCIPENRCPIPPEVESASHDGSRPYYLPGQSVRYTCDIGYYQTGIITISCLETYIWGNTDNECIPKSCGSPDGINNGRKVGSVYTFRSSVTYVCDARYQLDGLDTLFCQSDQQWSSDPPSCVRISCSDPDIPENGDMTWESDAVHYTCDIGYYIIGPPILTCRGDSAWIPSGITTCNPVPCDEVLQKPSNGAMQGDGTLYEDVVRFECDEGYAIEGADDITCLSNGTWSAEAPECIAVVCGVLKAPTNGVINAVGISYKDTVQFSCNDGFSIRGDSVRTCQRDGTWSAGVAECIDYCVVAEMPYVIYWTRDGTKNNRRLEIDDDANRVSDGMVENTTSVRMTCTDGFLLKQGSYFQCKAGTWDTGWMFCEQPKV